jgi:glutathione synthase/RimK-type ligase-like ATP-grasp enzyme
MRRVALVTARAVGLDPDLAPLVESLDRIGIEPASECWDDPAVDWRRYDLAILRSTWDYALHRERFVAWLSETERRVPVLNPSPIVRWNTDKHYLRDLRERGHPVVPTTFIDPDGSYQRPLRSLADQLVVKPAIGAGARDAARHSTLSEAERHVAGLLGEGRAVMVQPYLPDIDAHGESGLVYFEGVFSHSFRKSAMLRSDAAPSQQLYSDEEIALRDASADERRVADALVDDCGRDLLYARVDVVRGPDASPLVLELELTEPSFYFAVAPGSAARFARAVAGRLARLGPAPR